MPNEAKTKAILFMTGFPFEGVPRNGDSQFKSKIRSNVGDERKAYKNQ
jgi:hypothetical protein